MSLIFDKAFVLHLNKRPHELSDLTVKERCYQLSTVAGESSQARCVFYSTPCRVHAKLLELLQNGFNPRTTLLLKALCKFYNTTWPLHAAQFSWHSPEELKDAV